MDKTALLKKIRALAERGVGGEAENAEKLLARMMKKYGISEAELDEETRVRHDFTYHGGEEKKILKQVVYKVTGGYTYELVYTASGRGFASDREAWAELKECIERTKQMHTDIEKVHKEMRSAVKDRNEDAFAALSQEFERSSRILAEEWAQTSALAKIAVISESND